MGSEKGGDVELGELAKYEPAAYRAFLAYTGQEDEVVARLEFCGARTHGGETEAVRWAKAIRAALQDGQTGEEDRDILLVVGAAQEALSARKYRNPHADEGTEYQAIEEAIKRLSRRLSYPVQGGRE